MDMTFSEDELPPSLAILFRWETIGGEDYGWVDVDSAILDSIDGPSAQTA